MNIFRSTLHQVLEQRFLLGHYGREQLSKPAFLWRVRKTLLRLLFAEFVFRAVRGINRVYGARSYSRDTTENFVQSLRDYHYNKVVSQEYFGRPDSPNALTAAEWRAKYRGILAKEGE